jgi:hypothetical protein
VVAASQVVTIPDSLDDSTACQLTTSPLTALLLVREIGVQPGDRHLQTAAGSTVGKLVVQLARHRGIPTINVVRRRAAVAEIRQLGAGQPHRAGDHRGTPTAPGSGGRRSLAANEPPVEVAAVEDQLAHAVSNLVDNAARYATSIVRITLSCYDDTARIVVDDDGLGIPPPTTNESSNDSPASTTAALDPRVEAASALPSSAPSCPATTARSASRTAPSAAPDSSSSSPARPTTSGYRRGSGRSLPIVHNVTLWDSNPIVVCLAGPNGRTIDLPGPGETGAQTHPRRRDRES